MQGIFISYRRQDSQSAAGRLADHIKENLAGVPVFRDVETIEPGVDFIEAINRALASCGVLLAVIGPNWLSLTDANGRRRLDNPNDYTRIEITTALKRNNVRVIPVLVEGAQMPESDDLPEDLQALCRRNAIELTDKRWSFDVSQLIDALRKALNLPPSSPQPSPLPPPRAAWYRRLSKKQWGGIAAGIFVLSVLSEYESSPPPDASPPEPASDYRQNGAIPPAPIQPVVTSPPNNAAALPATLAGGWQDAEGGRYHLQEYGGGYRIEGNSPYGPVMGAGTVVNNVLTLIYTVNGVQYAAELVISADGNWLQGRYASAVTGERGMVALQRVQ